MKNLLHIYSGGKQANIFEKALDLGDGAPLIRLTAKGKNFFTKFYFSS